VEAQRDATRKQAEEQKSIELVAGSVSRADGIPLGVTVKHRSAGWRAIRASQYAPAGSHLIHGELHDERPPPASPLSAGGGRWAKNVDDAMASPLLGRPAGWYPALSAPTAVGRG